MAGYARPSIRSGAEREGGANPGFERHKLPREGKTQRLEILSSITELGIKLYFLEGATRPPVDNPGFSLR